MYYSSITVASLKILRIQTNLVGINTACHMDVPVPLMFIVNFGAECDDLLDFRKRRFRGSEV